MIDVFVSYSRQNLPFVERLTTDLTKNDKSVWFDNQKEPLQGIPAGSKWWDEIKFGIEQSHNFLIVVSPESMSSPYCHAEIAHALKHEKRIVTLLFCENKSQKDTIPLIDDAIDNIDPDLTLPESVSADIDNVRSLARRNWFEISQIQFVPYVYDPDWNQWLKSVI